MLIWLLERAKVAITNELFRKKKMAKTHHTS